jgi:hypothetical protein
MDLDWRRRASMVVGYAGRESTRVCGGRVCVLWATVRAGGESRREDCSENVSTTKTYISYMR